MNKQLSKNEIETREKLKSALIYKYPDIEFEVLETLSDDKKKRKVKLVKKFFQDIGELRNYLSNEVINSDLPFLYKKEIEEKCATFNENTNIYTILDTTSLKLDNFYFNKLKKFEYYKDGSKWVFLNNLLIKDGSDDYLKTDEKRCTTYKLFNMKTGVLSEEFISIKCDGMSLFTESACEGGHYDELCPIKIGKEFGIFDLGNVEILPVKFNEVPKGLAYNSTEQDRMSLYCEILKQKPELLSRLYEYVRNFKNPNNYIFLVNAVMDGLIENHLEDEKYCNDIIKMIKQETKGVAKENKNKNINTETKKVIDTFYSK